MMDHLNQTETLISELVDRAGGLLGKVRPNKSINNDEVHAQYAFASLSDAMDHSGP